VLAITQPLGQQGLFRFNGLEEFSEMARGYGKSGRMILMLSAQFCRRQHDLALRAALQRSVAVRMALEPLPLHKRIGGAGVKWVVSNRDGFTFDLAKSLHQ